MTQKKRIQLDYVYRPDKTKTRSSTEEPSAHNGSVAGSTPAAPTKKKSAKPVKKKAGRPKTGFDKREYQRLYMRDKTRASKEGLTVREWRLKNQ